MIKNSNCRITITISNKQKKWLDGMCEKLHLTTSKLIAWLLWTKSKDVKQTCDLIEHPKRTIAYQENEIITDEEMEEIIGVIDGKIQEGKQKINWKTFPPLNR